AGQVQRLGHGATVVRHDAGGRIDREGDDLLGRVVSDILDAHAAFGGDHESNPRGLAIDQRGEIEFLVDVGAVLDIEAVDLLAGRAGLHRHQRRAEHLAGEALYFADRLGEPHATLVAGGRLLELALAAAAGVDLALDHPDRTAKLLRRRFRLLRLEDGDALRDRHAEVTQQRLGLILVNIHAAKSPNAK